MSWTAENYYTADYPDDEVASDDEQDRNAYHYRAGNASDLEEFDAEDWSDDEAKEANDGDRGDGNEFKITIGKAPGSGAF